MCGLAVAFPSKEFPAQDNDRDHDELQVIPVVPKPQEQIQAEDNWNRTEAKNPFIPPEPTNQHIQNE